MNGHDETPLQTLVYHVYRGGSALARRLPYERGVGLSRAAGRALYRLLPAVRKPVRRNLGRVLGLPPSSPLVEDAVREAFETYLLYWFETFHVRAMPREELIRRTEFVGLEHIDAAVDAGRGGILALPHMGNWDAGGRWVTESGYAMTAVAEELKPRRMFELFHDHRRGLGMGIVALSEGRRVGEDLARLLAGNELICLVADRDLTGRGVEVEMFGAATRLPAGPALLSLATGAPLLPATTSHEPGGGWRVVVSPPLELERTESLRADVTALTRMLAASFERSIAADPTQWHVFQPFWPDGAAA